MKKFKGEFNCNEYCFNMEISEDLPIEIISNNEPTIIKIGCTIIKLHNVDCLKEITK